VGIKRESSLEVDLMDVDKEPTLTLPRTSFNNNVPNQDNELVA
jgi:hypothetical protein